MALQSPFVQYALQTCIKTCINACLLKSIRSIAANRRSVKHAVICPTADCRIVSVLDKGGKAAVAPRQQQIVKAACSRRLTVTSCLAPDEPILNDRRTKHRNRRTVITGNALTCVPGSCSRRSGAGMHGDTCPSKLRSERAERWAVRNSYYWKNPPKTENVS